MEDERTQKSEEKITRLKETNTNAKSQCKTLYFPKCLHSTKVATPVGSRVSQHPKSTRSIERRSRNIINRKVKVK